MAKGGRRKLKVDPKLKADPLGRKLLGPLIRKHPEILRVLDKHGVVFCAGCYLTLFSPLERAAAYHAVPDSKKFVRDVGRAVSR